jgi:hypothetical protein
MSAVTLERPASRRAPRPFLPLVSADLLKLRKRRGLIATVTAMTAGASVVTYGVLAVLHAVNPAHHGPAGGTVNLGHGLFVLSLLGAVAATIVGASAGAADLGTGVFRELVVTGRSRAALFASRIPGGLAFLLPFIAAGYALAAVASVVFAGNLSAPSTTLLVESGLWLIGSATLFYVLALGVASAIGSRTQTVGILLAFRLAVAPILVSISLLGVGRELLPNAALTHFAPSAIQRYVSQGADVGMSAGVAVVVIALWIVVPALVGAWRTITRDA